MSANRDGASRFLSCLATYEHGVEDASEFAESFVRLAPTLGLSPGRILLDGKHRTFTPERFVAHVSASTSDVVTVYTRDPASIEAHLYLRDRVDPKLPSLSEYVQRRCAAVVPDSARAALFELASLLHRHFGLISVNVAGHVEHSYAEKECIRIGVAGSWDAATVERIRWDERHRLDARTKLIRLSPITVIGPTLWATLPPMPRFDPAPIVDDLPGAPGCKVITAWPTLCSPRDPDFLRGTRALRAWLWPHTIQNPADDPANDPA